MITASDAEAVKVEVMTYSLFRLRFCADVVEMKLYVGKIRSIMPYGAFVEFLPGKDGLLHISEIDWKRLETIEEAGLKEGDEIEVKLLDIDPKTGKFKLSRKVLLPRPERQEKK